MDISEIKQLFEFEFHCVMSRFVIFELAIDEARRSEAEYVWHPGVYVWWHPDHGVVKVGRHLMNSRKRALEHATADTGGVMGALSEDSATKVLLFNVRDPNENHWVTALEVFFEKELKPIVRSGRLG